MDHKIFIKDQNELDINSQKRMVNTIGFTL